MNRMRWMVMLGLAALALAGCGGDDDGGSGTGNQTGSYCETKCNFVWDCMPESSRPDEAEKPIYIAACIGTCEIDNATSCPDLDEAACTACFTGTCLIPDPGCATCNCLL